MLTKSKRTPIKHSGALRAICNAHSVTVEDSNLMVCQGRKVVYVLRIGVIHSKNCFVKEPPTPSYRKESGLSESGWRSIAIPNGWKVALIVDNEVWTAEVSYDNNDRDLAQYKFALIGEEGEIIRESEWCYTPSGAFKSASSTADSEDQAWGRHNGKLYLGCTYDYPQTFIRNHFSKVLLSPASLHWNNDVKQAMRDWLDPVKQTENVPSLARVSSSSSLPDSARPLLRSSSRLTRSDSLSRVSVEPSNNTGGIKPKRKWEDSTSVLPPVSGSLASKRSCSVDSSFNPINSLLQATLGNGGLTSPTGMRSTSQGGGATLDTQNKRLDLANALFGSQIWSELVSQDVESVSTRLRSLLPASPRRPDVMSHMRAMTSTADSWLNESEVFALLQHVDIQVRRTASQKTGGPLSATFFTGGFFPFDAVSRVLALTKAIQGKPGNTLDEFMMNQIRMDEFIACLELIESCAEQVYPVIMGTLFMLPLEDIFAQIIKTKQATGEYWHVLSFVHARMIELGWTSFQQLQSSGVESPTDFVRATTLFLPQAKYIRKFTQCLYSAATSSPFSSSSSSSSSSSVHPATQSETQAAPGTADTLMSIAGFMSSLPTTWGRSASTPARTSSSSGSMIMNHSMPSTTANMERQFGAGVFPSATWSLNSTSSASRSSLANSTGITSALGSLATLAGVVTTGTSVGRNHTSIGSTPGSSSMGGAGLSSRF